MKSFRINTTKQRTLLPILCNHKLMPDDTTMNQGYLRKAFSGITAAVLDSRARVNTRLAL